MRQQAGAGYGKYILNTVSATAPQPRESFDPIRLRGSHRQADDPLCQLLRLRAAAAI